MERLSTVVLVIIATFAATIAAQGAENRGRSLLRDPHQQGVAALYADRPVVAADYVTAMMRYRTAAQHENLPPRVYPFFMVERPPFGGPWTWTAANGSHVRRLHDGTLQLSLTDQLGNWFVEVLCYDAGWPVFSCTDGIDRTGAAPDARRLVIDGVDFRRKLPAR